MRQKSMMNEEKYLIDRVGRENPFRVPEGYFDTLASQVMARVDSDGAPKAAVEVSMPRKARSVWMRPVYYAAAAVCALFISVAVYHAFTAQQPAQTVAQQAPAQQQGDADFDEAADYLMVDNQDIYACLSSDY